MKKSMEWAVALVRVISGALPRSGRSCLLILALLLAARSAAAPQQLGHKLLSGVGIDAGTQSEPGLYLIDRFAWYSADQVRDRKGNALPIRGLDIDAYGNVLGMSLTIKPRGGPYLSFAAAAPLAKISVNSSNPRVTLDHSGFGDVFVQPLKVGIRQRRFDAVASYAFYAPTGKVEPRGGGVGRGYWTHQLSAGGAVYFSRDRMQRTSVLASLDLNQKKHDIDIRRGNMFQIQGGAGLPIFRMVGVGVAGYALWQVSDDRGADIPPPLRGLRTRVFGLGPELNLLVPALRLRADFRFAWDFGVRSRPDGQVFVGGLAHRVWQPVRQRP